MFRVKKKYPKLITYSSLPILPIRILITTRLQIYSSNSFFLIIERTKLIVIIMCTLLTKWRVRRKAQCCCWRTSCARATGASACRPWRSRRRRKRRPPRASTPPMSTTPRSLTSPSGMLTRLYFVFSLILLYLLY